MKEFALDFERPLQELEKQIQELEKFANESEGMDFSSEILALQSKAETLTKEIYGNLSAWERVQLSRHPQRPHSVDYINSLIDEFHELHGDRKFYDDRAIITGFGLFEGHKVAVVAIEKGRKTKDKVLRNFGMPRPEGYRKALRIMEMAARFQIPILTFIDTPGAYPGIGAEERGQSLAIAENLEKMFEFKVPIISLVIGEGGSGGALAIAIADRVLMLEHSIYSVISPESCASILWADPSKANWAAQALKIGPQKALELKVIDGIISEPMGGAHRNTQALMDEVRRVIEKELKNLKLKNIEDLLEERFKKFRAMGNLTIN